tara:strand:- start:2979 stop:4025 length:1047 start_codon:yes stop_codon:yes gene_type:complete
MHIEENIKLDFNDVLIKPKRSNISSRNDVILEVDLTFKHNKNYKWTGVPIMVSNMDTTGTFSMALELAKFKMFTCIHKYYKLKEWIDFHKEQSHTVDNIYNYMCITSGIGKNDLQNLESILNRIPLKFISLDVANGYTNNFVDIIKQIRNKYPDKVIIAGTVATGEMTEELILSGADIVRVGIGGGSVCTTRKKAGVGVPQLSAIIECADAAHGIGGHIISDGGCTCPADFSKAFGAGSDFVMSGGMFSGHEESGGDLILKDGEQYKEFYGMSSNKAMDTHSGGVSSYRTSEGKCVLIKYKGQVKDTIKDILGGLRSTCTYVGALKLKELSRRTTFIRVTRQLNEIYS